MPALTVSMATQWSDSEGALGARPPDVPQHQGPDWERLLIGQQPRVVCPGWNRCEQEEENLSGNQQTESGGALMIK